MTKGSRAHQSPERERRVTKDTPSIHARIVPDHSVSSARNRSRKVHPLPSTGTGCFRARSKVDHPFQRAQRPEAGVCTKPSTAPESAPAPSTRLVQQRHEHGCVEHSPRAVSNAGRRNTPESLAERLRVRLNRAMEPSVPCAGHSRFGDDHQAEAWLRRTSYADRRQIRERRRAAKYRSTSTSTDSRSDRAMSSKPKA